MSIAVKIKALLAKAQSTDNEAEAEAFFAKAYELMEKHQISTLDLESEDPMGEEATYRKNGQAAPDWDFRLLSAVAAYYGCKAIQCETWGNHPKTGIYTWLGHQMTIVGRLSARVTTIEMHKYLVGAVRKLGKQRAADMGVNADTAARRIGVALRSRVHSLAPKPEVAPSTNAGKNALMTLDALTLWIEKNYPDLKPIKGVSKTNNMARDIANGIGLHQQAGASNVLKIK